MQFNYFCLVILSTVSVAVLVEVKKIYVIERDLKTGQLRARRQNVPAAPSHTQARVGALDHLHQHMFNLALSSPLQQSVPVTATLGATGQHQLQQQQRQSSDLASTVDLTASDQHRTPIDYLTPPPNSADIRFQNFQPTAGASESLQPLQSPASAAVQAPPPPLLSPFAASSQQTVQFTSPFASGGGGFLTAQAQPPPTASHQQQQQLLQVSSPSNQVHSLSFAGQSLEQFTPYTPTLAAHDPAVNPGRQQSAGQQQQQQQQQQQNVATRWELGYDANDILTPPFTTASEQLPGGSGGGAAFFQQDFGPEAAGSVRHNKQYVHSGGGGGGALQFFGGTGAGGFDAAASSNNRFTPSDAVLRPSPNNNNNNNNVYWGTPKTAQQQPLRPSPTFAEPNAYRFNGGGNSAVHLHHGHHVNNNNHHVQYVDAFQMPFTGQFDGPLSQGTVTDHVVHGSFRIKRQLYDDDDEPPPAAVADRRDGADDEDEGARFGDRKPVYSFVKTDKNGNFKWSVRHGY